MFACIKSRFLLDKLLRLWGKRDKTVTLLWVEWRFFLVELKSGFVDEKLDINPFFCGKMWKRAKRCVRFYVYTTMAKALKKTQKSTK